MKRNTCIAALALAIAPAPAAGAAFDDEAAWRAALGGDYRLETFEALARDTGIDVLDSLGLRLAPLTAAPPVLPAVLATASVGGFARSGSQVLGNFSLASPLPHRPVVLTPLRPGEAIFALGYWNTGIDDRTAISFYSAAGALIASASSRSVPAPSTNLSFVGIVVAAPAARAVIAPVVGNGQFTLDDLQARVAPVPEPAGWLSLLAGLGVLLARGIRRRAGATPG